MNGLLCVLMLVGGLAMGSTAHAQENNPLLVSYIEWSSDGDKILIALQEGGLYIVDPIAQTVLLELSGSDTGPIEDAALQPNGSLIATVHRFTGLSLWNKHTGSLVSPLSNVMFPWQVEWSSDGQYLFASNIDEMYMRDASGNPLFLIPGAPEDIPNVAFSPSGEMLLLSFSGKIEVWDVTLQQMLVRTLAGGLLQSIQWSADGTTFVAANINNTREGTFYNIVVINPMTGERLRVYSGFLNQLTSAQWSPDETQILATSVDGTVYLIEVASGSITPIFTTDAPILSADWSPYGGQIAIGAPLSSEMVQAIDSNEPNFAELPVQIVVPDVSLERFQTIAESCGADQLVGEIITDAALSTVIAQLESATAAQIPPACAADLIAIAEALNNTQ